MRISIFGLGYVGSVSAACLAHDGHTAIGVDVSPQKMALVAAGRAPVLESGLEELVGWCAPTDGPQCMTATSV